MTNHKPTLRKRRACGECWTYSDKPAPEGCHCRCHRRDPNALPEVGPEAQAALDRIFGATDAS